MTKREPRFPTDTPLLSIPEVAYGLRRSPAWVYARIKAGEIPIVNTIASRRITREAFNQLAGLPPPIINSVAKVEVIATEYLKAPRRKLTRAERVANAKRAIAIRYGRVPE